ncbi:MAG: stress response protein [Egibacteraceae bacterium]
MSEETWHAARLIPTSGIGGADEQERRATSALLAVVSAVKEFGRTITAQAGAPAGAIECFVEVPFAVGDREMVPDGLIRVCRGQRCWTALVEVKTGSNQLQREQLESYLDIAREQRFDALLTISNQIPAAPGAHPTEVDRRKLRKVSLHHLSWTQVLTEAVIQKMHRGVADPDQAWILGELIRYLEHPRSGAMEFDDMGGGWVAVRNAVRTGTLRPTDPATIEVVSRWDQLIRYACLRLGRQLGTEVQPVLSRKETANPSLRAQALIEGLVCSGVLEGSARIPNAVGPVRLSADLRAGQVAASITIDAPRDGRPLTRVNWLLRQLKDAPDGLRIDAHALHSHTSTSELLKDVRAKPTLLIADPKRELKAFTVTLTRLMGTKRSGGRASFITSVLDLLDSFYESMVQSLRPWSVPAPKLRKPEIEEQEQAPLSSTALSSQDGPEPDHLPLPAQERAAISG